MPTPALPRPDAGPAGSAPPAPRLEDRFVDLFRRLDGTALNGVSDRVRGLRRDAIAAFAAVGLPTRKSEAWKYTPIARALPRDVRPADPAAPVTAADVDAARVPGLDAHTLVLVNGAFRPDLSDVGPFPDGVVVDGLDRALHTDRARVEAHLGAYTRGSEAFSLLNTAFLRDGVVVLVPAGVVLDRPVLVLALATGDAAPGGVAAFVQERVLVVAEAHAEATVVERAVTVGGGAVFANRVTEVAVGTGGHVRHYRVQDAGPATSEVTTLDAYQHAASTFTAHTVTLGGATVRNNLRILPDGERCESHLRGLFLADGTTHVDNATFVDHARPHCHSNEVYKGILDGQAKGVFNGKILVRPDAQKTDAYQSSRAIVLSEGAEMYSKPELEIYADDVKCSHGAATGRLDDTALFYLRARGLTPAQARSLLLLAFARDVTDAVGLPALHDWLDARLQARLHTEG